MSNVETNFKDNILISTTPVFEGNLGKSA